MKISKRQLKKIIYENLLLEDAGAFSAAATNFAWNAVRGMPGAVTTHGRSLLTATQGFTGNAGTGAADFAARASQRAVMNHNMKSLTSCINRMTSNPAAREQIFRLLQRGMGSAGRQFGWQGGRMVFTGAAESAAVFGSGITAASAAIFLGAIAAAMVVPAIAIHEFATMDNLDKRLKNLYRMTGEVGNMKPVKPFSDGLLDVNSKPAKELTAVLPLIFQGFGKGENAILRQKARLPIGKIGDQEGIEAKPEALEMGNRIIELINDGIVDKNDLSNRYYEVFIVPLITEQKKAKEAISALPDVSEITQGDPPDASIEDLQGDQTSDNEEQTRSNNKTSNTSGNSKVSKVQRLIGMRPDGEWSDDVNIKLGAFAVAESFSDDKKVKTTPDNLEWWKDWKNSAPKIKKITVGSRNMTFGTPGNPSLKGNIDSLIKVLEFIKDSRETMNESFSRGTLLRRRYRKLY